MKASEFFTNHFYKEGKTLMHGMIKSNAQLGMLCEFAEKYHEFKMNNKPVKSGE